MGKIKDHNADVISDLKGRHTLALAIFFGSLAMIPLGFVIPCGLAMSMGDKGGSAAVTLAIASILLPFVGLGGLLLMWGDRSKYARALALAEIADERNLRFTYQPQKKQYRVLRGFRLLENPDSEFAMYLMSGKVKQLPFFAVDYNHAYGFGRFATVYRKTVFVFTEGFAHLPAFVLSPRRGWLDMLAELITGVPLKLSNSSQFNKQYALVTDEAAAAEALFTSKLVRLCLEDKTLTMEARRGMLLIYPWETVVSPRDYDDFLDLVLEIAGLLRSRVES